MRRLNIAFFMDLGSSLGPLAQIDLDNPPSEEMRRYAYSASESLKTLKADETIPLSIPASREEIEPMLNILQSYLAQESPTRGNSISIYLQASKLQTLLRGELAVQSAYYIIPKRAYDTNILINRAQCFFDESIRTWLTPDELYDIEQAGKCIAFETPTAAGFHLIRATESVIRRYYAVVVGTLPTVKMRSWGIYLRALEKNNADSKVMHAIEQVKDLHRNPVMHPEDKLEMREAISLLGIVESLVSAIHADMMRRAPVVSPQNKLASLFSMSSEAQSF